MMDMFRCPNGWQMPSRNVKAIEKHRVECYSCKSPREPFSADKAIDDAARGIPPKEPLNVFERAQVLHRLLTMPPGEMYERMFRKPFIKAMDKPDHEERK